MDSIINYLDKYSDLLVQFNIGFSVIILSVLIWVWFYNRKKYNHLKHQIPASVVKSYLDSIIQNSTALKSSLFRGGGIDVDPSNIPSVMPLGDLPGGTSISLDGDGDAALKAQVAQLQAQLAQKNMQVTELETKNAGLSGDVKAKQERIEELEKLLAEGGSGGDPEAAAKLAQMTKERDALKEELQQYDVISDDLANMKRLKQENEQLKKALADAGASIPEAPAQEPAAEVAAEPAAEEPVAEEPAAVEEPVAEEAAEPVETAAQEEPAEAIAPDKGDATEDKSPEDLLSEFEKMLG